MLNVKDFGAKGDGKTDDTAAIQQCLDKGQSVFFPPGVYLVDTIGTDNVILHWNIGGKDRLVLYAAPAYTQLLTKQSKASCQIMVYAPTASHGCSIVGLVFHNAHENMIGVTQAIFLTGTDKQCISNFLITQCSFSGYSMAIQGQGVYGWHIIANKFLAIKGHDDAQQNAEPAVFLWFADNESGYCASVQVLYNDVDGRGTLKSPRPMDGFVYGMLRSGIIRGNHTSNLSEEHYFLQKGSNDSVLYMDNNILDCSLPKTSKNDDGSTHNVNYGIRCDRSHALIYENILVNATWGILCRPIDNNDTLIDVSIKSNVIYMTVDPWYARQKAIEMVGSINHVEISKNEIHAGDQKDISLSASLNQFYPL